MFTESWYGYVRNPMLKVRHEQEAIRLAGLTVSAPPKLPVVPLSSLPPTEHTVRVQAALLKQDQSRIFGFATAAEARDVEESLGEDFDRARLPPDFKELRVWGKDRGIDP